MILPNLHNCFHSTTNFMEEQLPEKYSLLFSRLADEM